MKTIFRVHLLLAMAIIALAGGGIAEAQITSRFCDSLKLIQAENGGCCLKFSVLNSYDHRDSAHSVCALRATVGTAGATIVSGAGPSNASFVLGSPTVGQWNVFDSHLLIDSGYQLCVRNPISGAPTQIVFQWYTCSGFGQAKVLCTQTVNIECPAAPVIDSVFTCGKVAVTCEAVNDADPVMAIMSLAGISGPPPGSNWSTPATTGDHGVGAMAYSLKNLGQIFGLAYDNSGIYVTSTSIYDPAPGYIAHAKAIQWGTINTVPHPGGGPENSGSIYRISNHVITELADLPNSGEGLGNICADKLHNRLYVTNFHDGLIYIVDPATGGSVTFDPKFDNLNYKTAGTFAPLGQRPWGIAVWGTTATNAVLYYSRWVYDQGTAAAVLAANAGAANEIWSVQLSSTGIPIPSTEVLVKKIPAISGYAFSNPIGDLEISTDGTRMLASERTMYKVQSAAHQSRLLELRRSMSAPTIWVFEPLAKFTLGGSALTNATGGCDYGDIGLDGKSLCTGTVYGMSDYINATGFGIAYGFQIMNPNGGAQGTSKIVDLNNVPGTGDKTLIGDIDYRRCLDCPPPIDSCALLRSDTLGGTCCKGGLLSVASAGVKGIVKISYLVTNGVVQGFTSNCLFTTSPANVAGTTSGTLNFAGTCALQDLYGSLQATSLTGEVTIAWTVTFANGTTCVYVSNVKSCPPPPRICSDIIDVKQCNCGPTSSQGYLDINITNAASPAGTLCGVLISKLDAAGLQQTGYWASGSYQNPAWTPVNVAGSPVVVAPLTVSPNGIFHAQMYFFGTTFTGAITIKLIHCTGTVSDTCTYDWRPTIPTIGPKYTLPGLKNVHSLYDSLYSVSFRLIGPADPGINISAIKYWSISTIDDIGVGAKLVAVTGAEQYQEEKSRKDGVAAPLGKSSMASRTALFELQRELRLGRGDSSEITMMVFANAHPSRLRYSLYDTTGALISTDTVTINSSGIADVHPTTTRQERNDDFLLMNGYPNPANDRLNVRYMTGTPQQITFSISESGGAVVQETEVGNIFPGIHDTGINISKLPNGAYMVRMKSAGGLISDPVKIVIVR